MSDHVAEAAVRMKSRPTGSKQRGSTPHAFAPGVAPEVAPAAQDSGGRVLPGEPAQSALGGGWPARNSRARRGRRPKRHRRQRDRGVAAVELALVLPLVVALLFGMIDFGVVLNDYQSLRAGTRDGARNAVVADFDTVSACSGAGSSSQSLICSVKALTSLDSPDTRVRVLVPGTGEVGAPLIVCAAEPMQSTSGVFASVMNGSVLKSKVTMRIEVEADPILVTASDPAVSGDDWSWCTPS